MGRDTKATKATLNHLGDRAYQNAMMLLGAKVTEFDSLFDALWDKGVYIRSLRFKLPTEDDPRYLVVIKADTEQGSVVGFHGDDGFAATLQGTLNRLRNGSIKWKVDEYGG